MASTALPTTETRAATRVAAAAIPWHVAAVLFASASVVIGVIWDISWHITIGRDTLWSAPHLAIYLGGIVAGLSCGALVLRTTFGGDETERAASVRFWKIFYGPLGAWVCIWGTFAMLTSAPFDDWWHNAYGLDVEIISPPHAVLALGIGAIQLGAILMTLALQNREEERGGSRYRLTFAIAAGLFVLTMAVMGSEYMRKIFMHGSLFYRVACALFPALLIAAAYASRLRWPATTVAAVYTGIKIAMGWILPLFGATPRLAPIYQDITHMVPMDFPVLVIVPAIAIDLLMRRWPPTGGRRDWALSAALGIVFFALFFAVQWPFADFLMSPAARNRFFFANNFPYFVPKTSFAYRGVFPELDATTGAFARGLAFAALFAMLSSRIGLWIGAWMTRVRR
jgi:hypothetical protein